jgi:hypothetical protein
MRNSLYHLKLRSTYLVIAFLTPGGKKFVKGFFFFFSNMYHEFLYMRYSHKFKKNLKKFKKKLFTTNHPPHDLFPLLAKLPR